jgi:hypothetical protein
MFVYGKVSSKYPYSVNILTLFKLSETLENIFSKLVKNDFFLIRIKLVKKTMFFLFILDRTFFLDAPFN